jgi:hypothetical protein
MMMERKTRSGYMLLADISGYTSFVAKTEIEHADLAIAYLLETIVEGLSSVLTISQLEGDAVFAYVEDDNLQEGKSLMGLIDQTYLAFRDKALALHAGATCLCKACRALPTLDLKFMLHHGEFIVRDMAGSRNLLGTDVNLLHRLAKNRVSESIGWKGYALFTNQGLEHMQADKATFLQQAESYEHLGEVETYVIDMHARYHDMKNS